MIRSCLASMAAATALTVCAILVSSACGRFGETPADADPDAAASASETGAGADATPSPEGGPDAIRCPPGRGAAMVSTGRFCIDATEATSAEYAQFLSEAPTGQNAPQCKGLTYAPGTMGNCSQYTFEPAAKPSVPVQCVSWCNAYVYCKWAGKRLCGALAQGGGAFPADIGPGPNEWSYACSGGPAAKKFPYGAAYDASACVTGLTSADSPQQVATKLACVGGFPGLFDMSGNVREWVDACNTDADGGADALCLRMGGSYAEADNGAACDGANLDRKRSEQSRPSGIRCCSDLVP